MLHSILSVFQGYHSNTYSQVLFSIHDVILCNEVEKYGNGEEIVQKGETMEHFLSSLALQYFFRIVTLNKNFIF